MRELQGRWPGLHWGRWEVGGGSSVVAQGPYWTSADVGQGKMAGIGRLARDTRGPEWRELAGTFGWPVDGSLADGSSGWEWNRLQPGEGAAELLLPRPAPGKMQSEAARRAGEPPGQGKEPPPEGLGGHYLLAQAEPRRPAGEVMRHFTWTASQAALAAKRPEGRWFSPTPYLRSRMAFSISAWRR